MIKTVKTRTIIFVLSILLIISVIISTPYTTDLFQWGAYVFLGILAGISAIGEILELLGRKKDLDSNHLTTEKSIYDNKNPFRPKITKDSIELFSTSVALWGPVASGKSYLVSAFARTLLSKYTEPINGLRYGFKGIYPDWEYMLPNLHIQPSPTPLNHLSPHIFLFERRRTSSSRREALSSFAHEISIFDYSGEYSEELLDDENDYLVNHIMTHLASADIILVTLDPDKQKYLSKEKYVKLIKELFLVLDKISPEKKRFYAMCLTKSDAIPADIEVDPNGLIELLFGSEMIEIFSQVAKKHEIQTFITSSIGFVHGTNKSNWVRDENEGPRILDREHWEPYGVEFPFFWAFESIEKNRIKSKFRFGSLNIKNYIGYPHP